MNQSKLLVPIILIIGGNVFADNDFGVPKQLFGIELGGIYDVADETKTGDLPIKKFAGMQRFLGQGIHYYFQPIIDSKAFDYVERKGKPEDRYFKTSFRLYLLPVIPSSIKSNSDFETTDIKWEVTTIEWSNKARTEEAAYYWAIDLCKTFTVDIAIEPEITDLYDLKLYECTFSAGDREFKVSSNHTRSIALSFDRKIFDRKNDAVEKILRKLEANEIRPY